MQANVHRAGDTALALSFFLRGDLAALRIPLSGPPRRADRLWQHTCFEAFVRAGDEAAYHEFNLAPSGEWAAYRFQWYRQAARGTGPGPTPEIKVSSSGQLLQLEAVVPLDSAVFPAGAPLRLGLSAVLEGKDGSLSYWALKHPPGKADFHHADAFAIVIPA